ncbi:Porin, eukaryotic type [Sesbania bispinosa]|nr:Porin, eukaryotic type [Sesbania bispinosa]
MTTSGESNGGENIFTFRGNNISLEIPISPNQAMAKGPGLYSDIGKKARDLLFKDYHSDQKFTITTYSPTGVMFYVACVNYNVGKMMELFEESRMVLLDDFNVLCLFILLFNNGLSDCYCIKVEWSSTTPGPGCSWCALLHNYSLVLAEVLIGAITSSGTRKGELFVADVNTQLKNKNITTDIKVDTDSNLFTTIIVNEPAPGLKAIFSFKVPDQRSGKVELQYLHDYAGISSSIGLTANPIVNFSGVIGTNVLALGADLTFDTKSGELTKSNAGLSFTKDDLIASLTVNDKGDALNASYFHVVNPLTATAVGAEVTHRFSTNENTLTLGTQHALDPLTTVKARVNNFGRASALIQHEWRPKSFFTISGEVDTKAIEKSAKVGLALALKP